MNKFLLGFAMANVLSVFAAKYLIDSYWWLVWALLGPIALWRSFFLDDLKN